MLTLWSTVEPPGVKEEEVLEVNFISSFLAYFFFFLFREWLTNSLDL
jgi:hypothetical protein